MSIRTCIACSTAADAAYLQSEGKAAERERRSYVRQVARKLAALMQDYTHLRRALLCLNVLAVLLTVAYTAWTAIEKDAVLPRNAQFLFSATPERHPGVAKVLSQAKALSGRPGSRISSELDAQFITLRDRLGSRELPLSAGELSDRLDKAAVRFTGLADNHMQALKDSGAVLLERTKGATALLDGLQNIFAPADDSTENTKERTNE